MRIPVIAAVAAVAITGAAAAQQPLDTSYTGRFALTPPSHDSTPS